MICHWSLYNIWIFESRIFESLTPRWTWSAEGPRCCYKFTSPPASLSSSAGSPSSSLQKLFQVDFTPFHTIFCFDYVPAKIILETMVDIILFISTSIIILISHCEGKVACSLSFFIIVIIIFIILMIPPRVVLSLFDFLPSCLAQSARPFSSTKDFPFSEKYLQS